MAGKEDWRKEEIELKIQQLPKINTDLCTLPLEWHEAARGKLGSLPWQS